MLGQQNILFSRGAEKVGKGDMVGLINTSNGNRSC